MEIKDRLYIAKNMKSLAGIDEERERERVLAVVITKQMEKERNESDAADRGRVGPVEIEKELKEGIIKFHQWKWKGNGE